MYHKFCCKKQQKHFIFHTFKDTGSLPVDTCASGSAVEHLLAKEGVAGSIPVSRSFIFLGNLDFIEVSFFDL